MEHLVLMDQVAEEKAHKYGAEFIEEILSFCQTHSWSTDCLPVPQTQLTTNTSKVKGEAKCHLPYYGLLWIILSEKDS